MSLEETDTSEAILGMSKAVMAHKLRYSCRLCMNERRSSEVSLYERTSKRTDLQNAEIVQLFTDIEAHSGDGLPETICTKCENMLHLILDFKIECQESNEQLLAIYDALNPKEMEVLHEEEEEIMSIEALEETDEEEIKPEIDEKVELMTENEEFMLETDHKQEVFLLSVVDDENFTTETMLDDSAVPKKGTRNKTSKCSECGKMVEGPAKLVRHMRVHERERKKASQTVKSPKKHIPTTIFSCNVCKKEFNLASRLKKHLETHLPMSMREKSYVCQCGKQYLDAGALRAHQQISHSDNVPLFACEICGKEFTRKNYRDYHQRLHTSDKPHACQFCDFRSAKRHNLLRHMLIHNNQLNFECEGCGKKFKRKTGLDTHQKMHGCIRSFICPHCARGYPTKQRLLTHLQNVHEIKLTLDGFDQFMLENTVTNDEQVETDDMNLIYAIDEIANDT